MPGRLLAVPAVSFFATLSLPFCQMFAACIVLVVLLGTARTGRYWSCWSYWSVLVVLVVLYQWRTTGGSGPNFPDRQRRAGGN
ncbi:MAG: hypothetical protein WCP26_08470 [Actinomycetes bacterium]